MTRIGNKTSILPILYSMFPAEYERYIEPFGGSASVLLGKEKPDKFEVFNDRDGDLVNFFRVAKNRTAELLLELGLLPINSRLDFEAWRAFQENRKYDLSHVHTQLEIMDLSMPPEWAEKMKLGFRSRVESHEVRWAADYLKLTRHSYASDHKSFAGKPFCVASVLELIKDLGKRFENVVIENLDFARLIQRYDRPGAFFYLDPPYVDTEHFYPGAFCWEDHIRLWDCLNNIQGRFLMSYNDCPEVRGLYKDYMVIDFQRQHTMAQKKNPEAKFQELLIANYDVYERERQKPVQISISDMLGISVDEEKNLKEQIIPCKNRNVH